MFGRAGGQAHVVKHLVALTALALVRFGRFPGRLLFSGMVYAPLVSREAWVIWGAPSSGLYMTSIRSAARP